MRMGLAGQRILAIQTSVSSVRAIIRETIAVRRIPFNAQLKPFIFPW
jgi:hypothetical protein